MGAFTQSQDRPPPRTPRPRSQPSQLHHPRYARPHPDKNVNEFLDFLTPRLANKVYLNWMRNLRSYEQPPKRKDAPAPTA